MRRHLMVLAGLGTTLFAQDALAHHAYAMFDVNKEVVLHGMVKDYQWTSPHVWMDLMIRDSSGRETEWPIEGASPSIMGRFGWRRDSMKPGDRIEMTIHPRKDGSTGGSLVAAVVNGQTVGAASRPA
jgi:hypothetical protein